MRVRNCRSNNPGMSSAILSLRLSSCDFLYVVSPSVLLPFAFSIDHHARCWCSRGAGIMSGGYLKSRPRLHRCYLLQPLSPLVETRRNLLQPGRGISSMGGISEIHNHAFTIVAHYHGHRHVHVHGHCITAIEVSVSIPISILTLTLISMLLLISILVLINSDC